MANEIASESDEFERLGFVELTVEAGMTSASDASKTCSGARSDCCTRVCSADPTFVGTASDWEAFLSVQGGEIQY